MTKFFSNLKKEVVGISDRLKKVSPKCLSLKKVDSLNFKQWVVTFFKGKSI